MLDAMIKDLRYGARVLIKSPAFTVIAVLTLALGIGANSTVFTWAKAVITNPLPGATDPGTLVTIHEVMTGAGNQIISVSYPDYKDFRDDNDVFQGLAASIQMAPISVGGGDKPERIWSEFVSANYFSVLGVKLEKGRGFLPDEETTESPVVVIGDSLWRRRYSADPGVVGKQFVINNRSFTIVGVAPAEFQGSVGGLVVSAWVPVSMSNFLLGPSFDLNGRGQRSLSLIGRLRPGIGVRQAESSLRSIAGQLARDYPSTNSGNDVRLFPLSKEPNSGQAFLLPALAIMFSIAALVLLIACANMANLLLARGARRQKELAIRSAVGASRSVLVRQLVVEALLLSFAGGVAGLLLALWTTGLLIRVMPNIGYPVRFQASVDFGVLAFTLVVTSATILVAGLIPALRSSAPDLVSYLKEGARSGGASPIKSRLRSGLVAAQVALSCVTLVAAGLLIRTVQQAGKADPGFNPDNVLVASVDLRSQGYDDQAGLGFYRRFLDGIKAAPAISSVSFASRLPLRLVGDSSTWASIEGYVPRKGEQINLPFDVVGPDYFSTMQMPIVEGRGFSIRDDSSHPASVVINQALAERYFAGRDPLGLKIDRGDGRPLLIVGVAGNAKYYTLNEPPTPYMYLPLFQNYSSQMFIVARTVSAAGTALAPISDQVRAIDPSLPLFDVRPLLAATSISLFPQVLSAKLLGVFGLLALLLASIGAYGVISYSVTQRRHEVGIRMALGAGRREVLGLVVFNGMLPPAIGLAAGLALALATTRLMGGLLIGVSPYDPFTYGLTAAVLVASSFVAAYIPARRACSQDPMLALRNE